ncbi:hypothetical protein F183_A51450 [Bryobacterales bacterium F-183]|nr:hypothetical protein F183_A51450 [Bryobacterales bacterium F-183]
MGTSQILFGAVREKVLTLLYGHPAQRFYQREIIDYAGLGSGATQRELAHLASVGVLLRTHEGRQTYFQANAESPLYPELVALIRKTTGIAPFLALALEPVKDWIDFAFLYGEIGPVGPLHLAVVGDITMRTLSETLQPAEERLGRKIEVSLLIVAGLRRKSFADPKVFLIGDAASFGRAAGAPSEPPPPRDTAPPRKSKSR